jgi:hypothetical protein
MLLYLASLLHGRSAVAADARQAQDQKGELVRSFSGLRIAEVSQRTPETAVVGVSSIALQVMTRWQARSKPGGRKQQKIAVIHWHS